jgi:hypothetical protein
MKKPIFYDKLDKCYNAVMRQKFVPEYFREHPRLSAAILGSAGTSVVLKGTQELTELLMPQFYNTDFKTIEALCVVGLVAAGVAFKNQIINTVMKYPVYPSGVGASAVTSIAWVLYDIANVVN